MRHHSFRCISQVLLHTMEDNVLHTSVRDFPFSPEPKLLKLPIERNENFVRRNIRGVIFSSVEPTPLSNPSVVSVSIDALKDILDLHPAVGETKDFADFVAGNLIPPSSTPLAHRYGGHQFGVWASQLGDGRAVILGEYMNRKKERWELQLKGAGKTPYSRDGDGRAVLRSSIREYLCSEAMYYLGIPTSRAGALVVSSDQVVRDLLYDGHPQLEPCAVVLRLAQSWFRIGSFELLAKNREIDLLKEFVQFVVSEHFPEIPQNEDAPLALFKRVAATNCDLVIEWQAVGFTHGVLNSDNISILGITIDYGPFGFLEGYDVEYTPNHSDSGSRYCYGAQPSIMLFNLLMLARALAPLLNETQMQEAASFLQERAKEMNSKLEEKLSRKLGLDQRNSELITMLLDLLADTKADFVMVFRQMSEMSFDEMKSPNKDKQWALYDLSRDSRYEDFLDKYQKVVSRNGKTDQQRREEMCRINPCYTLRNWIGQEVVKSAEKGDFSGVNALLSILKSPYTRQDEAESKGYAARPPKWAKSLCLSCSS